MVEICSESLVRAIGKVLFMKLRTDTGSLGSIYEILNYSATTIAILW